jgi:hypothetical protein
MTNNSQQNHNEMTKIKEAAEVSLSLYNQIDGYKLKEGNRITNQSLGQVLRSLVALLEDEPTGPTDTQSAA